MQFPHLHRQILQLLIATTVTPRTRSRAEQRSQGIDICHYLPSLGVALSLWRPGCRSADDPGHRGLATGSGRLYSTPVGPEPLVATPKAALRTGTKFTAGTGLKAGCRLTVIGYLL